MATVIHGAGPAGQRSPGLDLAIAGYLADNGVSGSGGTVTASDAPTAPAEGASASYLVTSAVTWPAGLVWSTDPDDGTEPTITDTALVSLFTVDGTTYAVMGATYPAIEPSPDETDPTPGTLGVVVTSTTADGTVTGATDETALHATPYSFRIDAGAWSAWQAGATYKWTSLTASTEYDFQHRVRDAAGNITEGTVVTDTTDAPSGPIVFTDDFNRANQALDSSPNWDKWGTSVIDIYTNEIGTAAGGDVVGCILNVSAGAFSADQYAEAQITNWSGTNPHGGVMVRADTNRAGYDLRLSANGTWEIRSLPGGDVHADAPTGSSVLTSGSVTVATPSTLRLEAEGTTLRAYINGVLAGTTSDSTHTTGQPGVLLRRATFRMDNFAAGEL